MLRAGNCASSGIVPCHGEAARQGRALRRSACRECGVRGRVCDGVQCVLVHGAVSLVRPHGRLRTPRTGGAERSGFTRVLLWSGAWRRACTGDASALAGRQREVSRRGCARERGRAHALRCAQHGARITAPLCWRTTREGARVHCHRLWWRRCTGLRALDAGFATSMLRAPRHSACCARAHARTAGGACCVVMPSGGGAGASTSERAVRWACR